MDVDQWRRISFIFHEARARANEERCAFLDAACGDDETIRHEVESLLSEETGADACLTLLAAEAFAAWANPEPGSVGDRVLAPGTRLGTYEIIALVGTGGMGQVYTARDIRLKRTVAVKILSAEFSADPDRGSRFEREAQAIAALNHPHICTIHDVGHSTGIEYLVMEYLDGETLRKRIETSPLSLEEVSTIAMEVADALSEAHKRGIVHRDVKPGNIMLTERGVKLLDFGLAKMIHKLGDESSDTQTATGMVLGTVQYMSPEQVLGLEVDARTDVFSLGVVMYEMVSRVRPFQSANVIETIDAILHNEPEALSARNRHVTPALEELIHRCLEKEKHHRCQSARELMEELARLGSAGGPRPRGLASRVRRHNLPVDLTSFIGRERDIDELQALLDEVRLLTLTGIGGCGKTRLALKLAIESVPRFAEGVWLIEFAPVTNPELIPVEVASVLGVQAEAGIPLTQRLTDFLEAKQLLLILDNCEHLVSGCATFVKALLRRCSNLRVLATSREPLRVQGEKVRQVASLSFPDCAKTPIRLADVARHEAVRLFVERARHVTPFELTEQNASNVAEICHRLDGIPLAVEMAAARLNVLSVDQIATRLRDRFRLLSGVPGSSAPRQQTLQSVIDWSYSLLSATEQTLFARLTVFAGSFSLEAAEAVCSDEHLKEGEILEVLARLVEKSLVVVDREHLGVRYRLLETLREYGAQKLRDRGDENRTVNRHREFFVSLAEHAESELLKGNDAIWLHRVELDQQNFRAAIVRSLGADDTAAALRIGSALDLYWDVRGHHREAREILVQSLERDQGRAPANVRAKALLRAGYFVSYEDLTLARTLLDESLKLWRILEDRLNEARALYELGVLAWRAGAVASAKDFHERSLTIRREIGDQSGIASSLMNLGTLAEGRGDYELASSCFEECLPIRRAHNNQHLIAISLFNVAWLAVQRADYKKAEALYKESLAIHRELDDGTGISQVLNALGYIYADGDYGAARSLFEESLSIARHLGLKRYVAFTLVNFASLACDEGNYEEAQSLANESLTLHRATGDNESTNVGNCLNLLGEVAFEQGKYDTAHEFFERSIQIARHCNSMKGIEITQRHRGRVYLSTGQKSAARSVFEESLVLAQKSGRTVGLADPHLGMGFVELLEGNCAGARSHFKEAVASYEERTNRTGMVRALLALGDVDAVESQYDSASRLYDRALHLAGRLGFKKGVASGLRSLGTIAARKRQPVLAARCYGACDAMLEAINGKLAAFQSIGYDAALSSVRSELGEPDFQRCWREGRSLPIDSLQTEMARINADDAAQ